MNKSFFSALALVLIAGIMSLSVTSCIDGKEDEKKDTMEALCHVLVSEDVLKVADITVHYFDANGEEATEQMKSTEWKKTWTTTKLPAKVGVWAQITPKNVGGSENYQLKAVATAAYIFHTADGKEWADGNTDGNPQAEAETVNASNIAQWCSNAPEVRFEVDNQGLCIYSGGNNAFCEWVMNLFGYALSLCYI